MNKYVSRNASASFLSGSHSDSGHHHPGYRQFPPSPTSRQSYLTGASHCQRTFSQIGHGWGSSVYAEEL